MGGHLDNNEFSECGDVIAVDANKLTGVPFLEDCTFTDCHFMRITIIVDKGTGLGMKKAGFVVSGLD
ncbi:hypothetical protein C8024_15315 [Sphingopyxis sp. BSNA05]|nr:hypothetical protein [Sphingopyxis sp. BSNA05]